MASVAKWLRQRIVVPPFVGSSPIVRPRCTLKVFVKLFLGFWMDSRLLHYAQR